MQWNILATVFVKGIKMERQSLSESNYELWHLIGKVNHLLILARQRELNQYHIPVRQAYILRVIHELGSKATLYELAKKVERTSDVISRQAVKMENDGLIQRIKDSPKSKILRLELTKKGLEIIKVSGQSKSADAIFSTISGEQRQQLESILNQLLVKLVKLKKRGDRENL
jgi:DNA-binding MarR family transcriptional regulator